MHPHRILSTLCCNAQHAPTAHPAPADEVGVTPGLLGSWVCSCFHSVPRQLGMPRSCGSYLTWTELPGLQPRTTVILRSEVTIITNA